MSPLRRVAAAVLLLLVLAPAARAAGAADVGAVDRAGLRAWVSQAASRGAVAVVNYWATWCGPCREEIPHLRALRKEFPEARLAVLGVSLDMDQAAYQAFVQAHPFGYSTAWGGERLMDDLQVQAIPRTEIYGPDGRLYKAFTGMMQASDLRREIAALLGRGHGGKP